MQFIFFGYDDHVLFVRDDAESAEWQQEEYSLTATFPYVDGKRIERGQRIGFTDETGDFQAFEIRKVRNYEPDHYQEITAEHIVVSELTDEYFDGGTWMYVPPDEVLRYVLSGTLWQVGNVAVGDLNAQNVIRRQIENYTLNGNVDLIDRPVVYGNKIRAAGYDDYSGVKESLFSQIYTWDQEINDAQVTIATLLMTPIRKDGTVLSPEELNDYMLDLYEAAEDASGLKAADKDGLLIYWLHGDQQDEIAEIADDVQALSASWQEAIRGVGSSGEFSRGNVWQSVAVVKKNWNVYLTPRITFNGRQITGRYIDIEQYGGVYRGLRLSIDKNADQVGITVDDTNVITAMYGFGKSVQNKQTEESAPITFYSVAWEETEDHPAKPAGQAYLVNPQALALYGRNGRNRWGFYQNSEIDDPDFLLYKTWETMHLDAHPNVTIDCVVQDLYRLGYKDVPIRLHDRVMVELRPTGDILELEIVALMVDLLNPLETRPTIGKYIPNIVYKFFIVILKHFGLYGKDIFIGRY